MADRCLFLEDLLRLPVRGPRTFVLHEVPGHACVDARARAGPDWCFARRWIRTGGGRRELYRAIDRLEGCGFRFQVSTGDEAKRPPRETEESLTVRASLLLAELTSEERRLHAELFPEEHALLARGYDWDGENVYVEGRALPRDEFGRVMDVEGDVVYEWVRIADELTWRRYPLERARTTVTLRGR